MAVMDIVHYGDPILRKICDSVSDFSNLENVIDDMFDSMYEADGIGLAANQVGLDLNLFIIDITHTDEEEESHVFINGEILSKDGDEEFFQEGCLSLPGISLDILRPERVTLKYQSLDEIWHEEEFTGLLSRAIQHEMDHLKGKFIVDRVSQAERIQFKKELRDLTENSNKRLKSKVSKKGVVL